MRSILALVAAFTLSSSTAVSVVACGGADNSTTRVFDWNSVINGSSGETTSQLFKFLLENPDSGVGPTLYKDIIDYISLSILKTNDTFKSDYAFAKQSVENQIQNLEDSLKAKYGRSWSTQWNNFLKDPAQGGDGKTGSYERYFDVLLKSKATTIVSQYYVGDNYHNYSYYNQSEINLWKIDMYNFIKIAGKTMAQYLASGTYKDKVWIVASANNQSVTSGFPELATAIQAANKASDVKTPFDVAKTVNDTQPTANDKNYIVDPSNTIKGLLSDQQANIARVWMKNQGPIWARQIVVAFNKNDADQALKTKITKDNFSDNQTTLINTLNDIKSVGFTQALKNNMGNIGKAASSAASGDLGLVTLNSDVSTVKASFSYYLDRYVTSDQGIGNTNPSVTPYKLSNYNYTTFASGDLDTFIGTIDRQLNNGDNSIAVLNQTSKYRDEVWVTDGDPDANGTIASGTGGNKVSVFIDQDGIHFVQTPGITYASTVTNNSTQNIITTFNQQLKDVTQANPITWSNVQNVVNRPGGLTNNPYLAYLQTQYLLWQSNNQTAYFDLNDALNKFTTGTQDIKSDSWWDYILYFNHNIDNINWNLSDSTSVSNLLNTNISASDDNINTFVKTMKQWFITTYNRRWSLHQGILNTDTLTKNINSFNDTLNTYTTDAPPARLDAEDIVSYLKNIADDSIWWYDPNSIQN